MSVGAIRAGEAYVEIAVKDTTGAGVNSALRNYGRLQAAAESAQRASTRLQQTPQLGMVLQPRNGRLQQTAQRGLVLPQRGGANPYELAPDIDMQRAAARAQKTYGATEVGYFPPVMQRSGQEFAKQMKSASKEMAGIEMFAGKLQAKFLGIGVGIATISAVLSSVGTAIEKKLQNPATSFADEMSKAYQAAFDTIPLLGSIARIGRTLVFEALGYGAEDRNSERAAEQNRRLAGLATNRRSFGDAEAEAQRQSRDLSLAEATRAAQQAVGGEVFSEEQLQQKVAAAREATDRAFAILAEQEAEAIEKATNRIRDEAGEAGLLAISQGVDVNGREIFKDADVVQRRIDAETDLIRRQFESRRSDIASSVEQGSVALGGRLAKSQEDSEADARDAAEEAAKTLAEAMRRQETLQIDQQDRERLARLDAEDIALGDKDDPKSIERREQIAAERELIALQQRLDASEEQILMMEQLTLADRESLIARERGIAEQEAENIRASLAQRIREATAAVGGRDKTAALAASGTFSAFTASRRVVDNTDLAREANKLLRLIADNTTNSGVSFAP